MKPTVVIPACNAEATLSETLDSLLSQSCKPHEIIVVDDGSKDQTGAIANNHLSVPTLIRTDNQGVAAALNTGIAAAKGDVLAFLDADDLWLEPKLEHQIAFLNNQPNVSMVFTHMEMFLCPSVSPEAAARLVYPDGPQPCYGTSALMVYKEVFERHGGFDAALRTGTFIDWFSRIKTGGEQYGMLPDVLVKRRVRPGTLGQRTSDAGDGLSRDFVEVARRAIQRKHMKNHTG